jgi:ribosome-associated protein
MGHNKDGYAVEDGSIDRTVTHRKTRSERRNDAVDADGMAQTLAALRPEEVRRLPLSEHILEAVLHAQSIRHHGAKRRQMLYLAKLLRAVDPDPLREALADETAGTAFEELERWRTRILEEGDDGLTAFMHEYPDTDRQRIRQLARTARKPGDKGSKSKKLLFQILRDAAGL